MTHDHPGDRSSPRAAAASQRFVLEDAVGIAYVEPDGDAMHHIRVVPRDGHFVSTRDWRTRYPLDLIEHVFRVKGADYLCDEIRRDEDPTYVEETLRWAITSYVAPEAFAGRRILDFGSGSGASTLVLHRMFPAASEIVGIDLVPAFVELARRRARFHGVQNHVSFHVAPSPNAMPEGVGRFDAIVLSAVWEHLLPDERLDLLPRLWEHLRPGGVLFLNQTPYRWSPVETHTTGLPGINYLPARAARFCALRLSKRLRGGAYSWDELLRKGIRGGSVREVMRILHRTGHAAELLRPSRRGVTDRIDLWYALSTARRPHPAKRAVRWLYRAVFVTTRRTIVPVLTLALRRVD